ncbi:LuxR C-terminal-related transcriptional regulator [Paraburkholderia saeva]|uniref:HTH-type transcriptional regulator MalT n=1 Tax=Paraburkholderia saeva TaxID=2777537 RepID=A0A9N8WZH6_9BURK|nr:LuxR C-terminal-related transcriptional regulator [Paraburkholderia saeva]CAG4886954.1 HTH-type transcriptional regulator MalT [Paraburkholderia saeva]CAG4887036.1 HTH-type transcriptional regulator MalT [Paraburkholderia saeva]
MLAAIGTKIVPPRGARRVMAREALMARLMELRRKRCLVLRARAGSGKTSTLLAWRQTLIGMGFDVSWLSVHPDDNEWQRFSKCLLATLTEIDPAITREADMLQRGCDDELAIERWIIVLLDGLAAHIRPVMMMFDDLQHLTHPHVVWAMRCLMQYAPAHLHFAFGTRTALPLLPAHLLAQDEVAELGLQDLAFTEAESEAFLHVQLDRIDKREARILHRMTEGWVAGLQLFALKLKAQRDAPTQHVPLHDPAAFSSYFESELLVHMTPEDLDLLTRMSVCNPVSASLCAELVGHPNAVAATMTRLNRLDANDLFITQMHGRDSETWYKLHPLLREALQVRVQKLPETVQRALHGLAWHWFDRRGMLDEAVHHAVQAGAIEAAAELVDAATVDLMARGEMSRLAGLLRVLPHDHVDSRFRLRLAEAYLLLPARGQDAIAAAVERFDAQIVAGELNARQRFSVNVLRGALALRNDDAASIARLESALLDAPRDIDVHECVLRDNLLAWMYLSSGDYARARAIVAVHEHTEGAPREQLLSRCVLATTHAVEGRLGLVESLLRPVMQEAEKRGPAFIEVHCVAAGLLAHAMYELNQTEAARRLLEGRIDIIERIWLPDIVMRALLIQTGAYLAEHRHLDAFACLDRLEDYAVTNDLDRLRAHLLCARVRLYLRSGEMDLADASLNRLDAMVRRRCDATDGGMALDIRLCWLRARIERDLHRNAFDAAREHLGAAVNLCEKHGRPRQAVGLRLQLALAEQGCVRPESARVNLLAALQDGHRLGLIRTLLDVSPRIPPMLKELLASDRLDPVIALYVRRLLSAAGAHDASDREQAAASQNAGPTRGVMPLPALSVRERDILELVAQAMPNKKIARALNITPETVKWHLKNIFSKLGVSGRDEAAERLRHLKLDVEAESPR